MSEEIEQDKSLPSQEEVTSRRMDELAEKAEQERRDIKNSRILIYYGWQLMGWGHRIESRRERR
jgi:hypothetical protein